MNKCKDTKYSVLVDIDTSDAFYQEFTDEDDAYKIFAKFFETLSNDEDETREEIEEVGIEDVFTHTIRLYLFKDKESVRDVDFEITDEICGTRGYYEELL